MANLRFFTGTMESGKSTMALQLHHTLRKNGVLGVCYTKLDRNGAVISSRMGVEEPARSVDDDCNIFKDIANDQEQLRYVIADEVQFYSTKQIEQLAVVVDELGIDVYAFGILSDFTGQMFSAAKRLIELADSWEGLPVPARCWCGHPAIFNARVVDGVVVKSGPKVDIRATYAVLCRQHYANGTLPH